MLMCTRACVCLGCICVERTSISNEYKSIIFIVFSRRHLITPICYTISSQNGISRRKHNQGAWLELPNGCACINDTSISRHSEVHIPIILVLNFILGNTEIYLHFISFVATKVGRSPNCALWMTKICPPRLVSVIAHDMATQNASASAALVLA